MTRRKGREMDKKDKNTVEEDLRQEAKSAAQEDLQSCLIYIVLKMLLKKLRHLQEKNQTWVKKY